MSDSVNQSSSSAIVEAEQTINVLSTELVKFREIAKKWHIDFNVEVRLDGQSNLYSVVITGKTGERGATQVISGLDAKYYAQDAATIAKSVGEILLQQILGDMVDEQLTPQIVRAITNINSLNKSSL